MSLDLANATAAETARAVASGDVFALDVTQATLARIEARNGAVNAFTAIVGDRARRRAADLDAARAAGQSLGPLAGVPFAVKNLVDIAGLATVAGSKIERDAPPAAADAVLVTRLEAAGAVLCGALNMGEFAYDFTGQNAHYGNSLNPHDLERMSGGSSGGSGAAVAAGLVPLALGSDTNGSIRVPASFCGLFGLKPTFGRLTRHGTFPFVASFDHIGPLARSAEDLALAYDAMQGPDPLDAWCAQRLVEPVSGLLDQSTSALRIAVAGGYFASGGTPACFAAVDRVAGALGATRRVDLPEAGRARSAAFIIAASEGAAVHLDRLRRRPNDFDLEVRDRLFAGAMIPGSAVVQAQKFRAWYRKRVLALFDDVDVILAPAAPGIAPKSMQKTITIDGVEIPARANIGIFTQPISFIGLPVCAVPVWLDGETLPIGVQVIGAPWREDVVLRVAHHLQMRGVVRAPVAA